MNEEENNDILEGEGAEEELDGLQDVVRGEEGDLVPGGVDMD